MLDVYIIIKHVNIIMLYVDICYLHVNIFLLYVDMCGTEVCHKTKKPYSKVRGH